MKKPLIGLTATYLEGRKRVFIRKNYMNAIEDAMGIPVMLSYLQESNIESLLENLDGILFSGGDDVDPSRYGQERIPECEESTAMRDEFEIALCKKAFQSEIPIFGICRGIQVINVALGGTLWQDLPSQFPVKHKHSQDGETEDLTHSVIPEHDTKIGTIIGAPSLNVNSYHHQAVREAAPGLKITAYSDDGVPEALEAPDRKAFFLGIQWHPEYLYTVYPEHGNVFSAFVNAAAEYRNNYRND